MGEEKFSVANMTLVSILFALANASPPQIHGSINHAATEIMSCIWGGQGGAHAVNPIMGQTYLTDRQD